MTHQELLEKSVEQLEADDFEEALRGFNYLLSENSSAMPLLFYIGTLEMKRGNFGLAQNILMRVEENCKDDVRKQTYNNLGYLYHKQGNLKEADVWFCKGLELEPDDADLINNQATMYVNNGTPDKAIERCLVGLKIDPEHKHLLWNMGLAHLEKREWEEGWKYYVQGTESGHRKARNYHSDKQTPVWNGEEHAPKKSSGRPTVVIYGEQGVGDEIMFASIIPDAMKKADIIFECHPRLTNIYRKSFGIPVYGTRKEKDITWTSRHKIDYKLAIGSLGEMFRQHDEDFPKIPYLKADPHLVEQCKARFETDKPKVVIHWKGGTATTNKDYRSIPLLDWKKLLELDCEFISLQYTENAPDVVKDVNKKYVVNIQHWQDIVDDMDMQTAMIEACDLVISVCTSIVHISGAIGKECWCLAPKQVAWRYGQEGNTPWYGTVKMYRQKRDGDWKSVMQKTIYDLKRKFKC